MSKLEQAKADIRAKRGLDEAPEVEAVDPVDVPADDPGLAADDATTVDASDLTPDPE